MHWSRNIIDCFVVEGMDRIAKIKESWEEINMKRFPWWAWVPQIIMSLVALLIALSNLI